MIKVVLLCVIFIFALFSLSNIVTFKKNHVDDRVFYPYLGLSVFYSLSCFSLVLANCMTNPVMTMLFFWTSRVCILFVFIDFLPVFEYLTDTDHKWPSYVRMFLTYYGFMLIFADVICKEPDYYEGELGIYFIPTEGWHIALYALFSFVFIYVNLVFINGYYLKAGKRREKFVLGHYSVIMLIVLAGLIIEVLSTILKGVNIPTIYPAFGIAIFITMLAIRHHKRIQIRTEDYRDWLSPECTDVSFICDDELNVVFQNRRAEVIGETVKDSYVGRKIQDIFLLLPDAEAELTNKNNKIVFGLSALYLKTEEKINLLIKHVFDRYGEIFVSIISVINLTEDNQGEPYNQLDAKSTDDSSDSDDELLTLTRDARVFLVSDNAGFTSDFSDMLKPYQVKFSSCSNIAEAYERVLTEEFDIIYIRHRIANLSGIDLARDIRAIKGDTYYSRIPLVLCTDQNMSEFYESFLAAGFSDHLAEPISSKELTLSLTRWVWQRYYKNEESHSNDRTHLIKSSAYSEMADLCDDARRFYDTGEHDLFKFAIRGIKKNKLAQERDTIEDLAARIENAALFDDWAGIDQLLTELKRQIAACERDNN